MLFAEQDHKEEVKELFGVIVMELLWDKYLFHPEFSRASG